MSWRLGVQPSQRHAPELAVPVAALLPAADAVVSKLVELAQGFRRGQVVKAVAAGSASEHIEPAVLVEGAARTSSGSCSLPTWWRHHLGPPTTRRFTPWAGRGHGGW